MRGLIRACGLVVGLSAPPAAGAPHLVIYRCTAADGSVTLQNGIPCAKGSRSERRVIEALAAPVAKVAPAIERPPLVAIPAPATASPTVPAAGVIPQRPAPPIFACATTDSRTYFADSAESSHCAPLETLGLDGQARTDANACEVTTDACTPVAEDARCAAWAERRRVAEAAERFSPEQVDEARAELARIAAATAGSVCTMR